MRGFDFLIGVLALVVVIVGSLVVPAVLMLLLPSRKGNMRTERRITMPGDVEAAWDLLAGRFEYEGFVVERSQRPRGFNAKRAAKNYHEGDQEIVTHATKPLEADVSLARAGGAAATDVTIARVDERLRPVRQRRGAADRPDARPPDDGGVGPRAPAGHAVAEFYARSWRCLRRG